MAPTDAAVVRIGTRGSELAVWQANEVIRLLHVTHPGVAVEHQIFRTVGDKVIGTPLSKIGDKGLFTRELEDALIAGVIDMAVHSLKDLPTSLPGLLALGAVIEREDPRDALVAPRGTSLATLKAGARVGTSSLRRRAQLLARRPDFRVLDVRGNLPTRLAKLERGEYDALVLAHAGLIRLGRAEAVAEVIDSAVLVPAVGQGALGVEIRAHDPQTAALLSELDHLPTRLATASERAFLGRLEGGCQVPVGAYATLRDGSLTLTGVVADLDGTATVRGVESCVVHSAADAAVAGVRLAERLLAQGADEILARVRALALEPTPTAVQDEG